MIVIMHYLHKSVDDGSSFYEFEYVVSIYFSLIECKLSFTALISFIFVKVQFYVKVFLINHFYA